MTKKISKRQLTNALAKYTIEVQKQPKKFLPPNSIKKANPKEYSKAVADKIFSLIK